MKIKVCDLINMYKNGVMNIVDNGDYTFKIAGVSVGMSELEELAHNLGWSKFKVKPDVAIEKEEKLVKCMITYLKKSAAQTISLELENLQSQEYGKTYERLVFSDGSESYTLLCGMKSAGCKFVLYKTGNATPISRPRTLKAVMEFLNSKFATD